jgi:hypothetical protein
MKRSLLFLVLVMSMVSHANLPPTRVASCFTVLNELAQRTASTADAVQLFRKLHAKIGLNGWQSRGLDPVRLGSDSIDPLKVRTARGRLDTIRKDFTTGHQWASENGVNVRGVEIVGKENIESVLEDLEAFRLGLNQNQNGKLSSAMFNMATAAPAVAYLPALALLIYIDHPNLPEILAPSRIVYNGLIWAMGVRDFSKFCYYLDRRFLPSLREMRQRLSAGSEEGWYYFGDTVRVDKKLVDEMSLDPALVDEQDYLDLKPWMVEVPFRVVFKTLGGVSKKVSEALGVAWQTCLLSTDLVLMPGPEPRLSMLVRTYPKPPAYPVRQAERSFSPFRLPRLLPVRAGK